MNIPSTSINVYPTSKRDDNYDRNARVNSEYNITHLVNRLTNRDAFAITEIPISTNQGVISLGPCQFSIKGYFFEITDSIDITSVGFPINTDSILYAVIKLKENTVDIHNSNISFLELEGVDKNEFYTGLSFEKIDEGGSKEPYEKENTDGTISYYFPIAQGIQVLTAYVWSQMTKSFSAFDTLRTCILNHYSYLDFDLSSKYGVNSVYASGLSKNNAKEFIPFYQ